ncbi:MAG: phenylalanine--tRNA ligase subunit beta, partial [Planctomycetota bacterium]
ALAERLTVLGLEVEALRPVGEDVCLELEITADRPDLLSHVGVAREIAACTGKPLRIPDIELHEEPAPASQLARVEIHDPNLCPRYTARVLTDVQVGPSPDWMQRRLETIGLRPVNNVVDITNYVLMESGQPEHAFDFDTLAGNTVVVRPAVAGEQITLIDGDPVELSPERLVIADSRRPVALAGIMGGLDTEIGDGTSTVLLESAKFDPVSIRRSCRATAKASDSSYRFERTVDTPTVEWASRRAAMLIQQLAGAKVAAGVIDVDFTDERPRVLTLRVPRIEQVLGLAIDAVEAGKLLKAIGFGVKPQDHEALEVTVPSFRPDVTLEIDLIEEVARCHGYDRVPTTTSLTIQATADSKFDQAAHAARESLIRLGYAEAVTSSFLAEEAAAAFSPWSPSGPIVLTNPLRADEAALRQSLIPSLLAVKRTNQNRGRQDVRLFELHRVYLQRSGGSRLPEEKHCLAAVADAGFTELKGAAEVVLDRVGILPRCTLEPAAYDFLAPGAAAAWRMGTSVVGYVGELDEEAAARLGLHQAPCLWEMDFDLLANAASLQRQYVELPRFPAVERDLAVVVDEAVTWAQIVESIQDTGAQHLESIDFGEIYRGEQVERGRKSVFLSLSFRAPDRTLTHDEVSARQERIVAALADQLGATLRA